MKKAIVIGAGFGGMAAAIRLRKKGYKVEIVDRCNNLGGRAQVFNVNGFRHDAGPTLITAPFLFKELFQLYNKNINEKTAYVSIIIGLIGGFLMFPAPDFSKSLLLSLIHI